MSVFKRGFPSGKAKLTGGYAHSPVEKLRDRLISRRRQLKMKVLDYQRLMMLNESSISASRKQNLQPEQIPSDSHRQYTVNFRFDHEWAGWQDIRMSIILKPEGQTAWLDVSWQESAAIPEVEMSELEWGAAVHGSHAEHYYRAPRGRLTTRCHGYNISDKIDRGSGYLITN